MSALGRYPVYVLNRDHVAVPHIEALTRVRTEVVDRIRGEIGSWKVAPIHAGLFGSFARGEATADSDIDLLLVRPDPLDAAGDDEWLAQLDRLDRGIRAWTGNAAQLIDLTPTTLAAMARAGEPLVDSWRAEVISLHGERLLDLLRRLR